VDIAGVSITLEDLSPAADVHGTRYVNRIDQTDITVEMTARSPEESDMEAAKRAEDYLASIAANLRKQKHAGIVAPYRRHIDDMAFFGAGVMRGGFKTDVLEKMFPGEMPTSKDKFAEAVDAALEKGFDDDPFLFECPSINSVAYNPDFSEVCEIGIRTIKQALKDYDLEYDGHVFKMKDTTSETLPEYNADWDEHQAIYYHLETNDWIYDVLDAAAVSEEPRADSLMLTKIPNIIGRPWYSFTFAHVNNNPDVSKRNLPLINAVYPIVHNLNFIGTLLMSGALSTGRPMYQEVDTHGSANSLGEIMSQPVEQRPVLAFSPSEAMLPKPGKGKRWEPVGTPDMSWVVEAHRTLKEDLERYGFPVSLSPESSTSGKADSGVQGMQQIEVAANYLNPALSNVALSLYELFNIVMDALTEMGVPVKLPIRRKDQETKEMLTIKPADFKDVDLSVSLKSTEASAQLALRAADLELVEKKMMSKTEFFKRHYDDWQTQLELVFLDEGNMMIEQEMLQVVQQFAKQQGPEIVAQAAADQGIPLPPQNLAPPSGGPIEPGGARPARPPVPIPGVGAPTTTVDQNPLASAATAQEVNV